MQNVFRYANSLIGVGAGAAGPVLAGPHFGNLMKFVIGASVSEPHTSEFNGGISLIYIAILGECNALWGEHERVAGCISVS